ncbi:MAG: molybdenum cofactor biosynthesis protein MoeB [Elusimicrobia bacterium RIFCSPLOWO2_01_FULL_54_10]|nr:MAG: molybdenum cofactor biosynthesis protein MoeB [Elusimicrobia bacterium RIFCSPLOWO2_01_FULL_54_10]
MALSNEQIQRYSRHLIMPEVGVDGQEKLLNTKMLLIGAGGLGSPLGLYLGAAGVGTLGIVDFDMVDQSNLQRQIIHSTADIGRPKVESAKARINSINPEVKVNTYQIRLTRDNIMDIFKEYDIIVDGTDNFQTRYLVNDACVFLKKPLIYGSIFRFDGQCTVFKTPEGPCYRCLYPEPPPPGMVPSCAEGGVLGILPGIIGVMQATEAIKIAMGRGEPLIGRLLLFNAMEMRFREVKLQKDPDCPVCGKNPSIKELIDYDLFCGIGRGQEAAPENGHIEEVTVKEFKKVLDSKKDKVFVLDVREQEEWQIVHLPQAKLIPLANLRERVNELDTADEIYVHCKMGGRSAKAVKILKEYGFKKVKNVAGGIDAWANEIDPSLPRY